MFIYSHPFLYEIDVEFNSKYYTLEHKNILVKENFLCKFNYKSSQNQKETFSLSIIILGSNSILNTL